MCFSAQADIVGGVVVTAIGVDALRHVQGRRRFLLVAALPLMFGVHQLTESFVWWGLQGHVPEIVGHIALWIYLLFAFVVLPVYVPIAVMTLEVDGGRRRSMMPFAVLGAVVAIVLLAAMLRGPVAAELGHLHLSYTTDLHAGDLIVVGYVVATCAPLLMSGERDLALFGIVNLVAVAVIAKLAIDGFASLWCGWAAITGAAFAINLRVRRFGPVRIAELSGT